MMQLCVIYKEDLLFDLMVYLMIIIIDIVFDLKQLLSKYFEVFNEFIGLFFFRLGFDYKIVFKDGLNLINLRLYKYFFF